jgi:hypothetical protein
LARDKEEQAQTPEPTTGHCRLTPRQCPARTVKAVRQGNETNQHLALQKINYKSPFTMASRFFFFVLALSLSKGCLFVFAFASHAQETVNLVPNPSFEEFENGCPVTFNEMPIGWTKWRSSPNSFSTCVEPQTLADSLGGSPWTGWGVRLPADGESFCGLFAFESPSSATQNDFREYLGCQLEEPMLPGTTYYLRFQTAMAFKGYYWVTWASSHIGAIFTTQPYLHPSNSMPIPNFAHVYSQEVLSDTVNWVTIEGSFVADQAYTHMALGVFFEFDLLNTMQLIEGPNLGSYYFVDDVCVSKYPDCVRVSVSETADANPRITVYPNPANDQVRIESDFPVLECSLMDMSGRKLFSKGANSRVMEIALDNLADGAYVLEIKTTDNKTKREKLLIVH